MKQLFLLLMAACFASAPALSQTSLNLSGSSYFQGFDNVGSGLPTGWEIDSAATATSKGTPIAFDVNTNAWNGTSTTSGKGKNFAAIGGLSSTASSATQASATNRAMGLRQVGSLDSQAAFTLTIAQTTGLSNFNLAFNLQSLDASSPRIATWAVQYGIGANPMSFTTVSATGTNGLATGGSTFSNSVVTASFGSALNNISGPVVIRIVSLNKTTGTGNRPSTGIDSLTLSWTGTAFVYQPQVVSTTPANGAVNIAAGSNLSITFDKNVIPGAGSIYIRNATDQTVVTKAATSSDVTISGPTVTISNAGLVLGKTYRVTFDSTAFKTSSHSSFGIYDSTSWVFTTLMPVITLSSLSETFDAACANNTLSAGWSRQNVQGPGQQWGCYVPTGGSNAAMQMNGFLGSNNVNEDWLITPRLNLGTANSQLTFKMQKAFTGTELDVLVSTNYNGTGAPASATWTSLNIPMSVADTGNAYKVYSAAIGAAGTSPLFIAFKYVSTATDGYRIRLDSVVSLGAASVNSVGSTSNRLSVMVLGEASSSKLTLGFTSAFGSAMKASVTDMTGRLVFEQEIVAVKGNNRIQLAPQSLKSGMYVIRVGNKAEQGVARTFIQ